VGHGAERAWTRTRVINDGGIHVHTHNAWTFVDILFLVSYGQFLISHERGVSLGVNINAVETVCMT
jgi:hypothetical protein